MKSIISAAILLLLVSAAGCKKDKSTVSCKLVSRATNTDSSLITYDAQGRVQSFELVGEYAYTFTYTSALTAQCIVSIPSNPVYDSYNIFLSTTGTIVSMNNSLNIGGSTYDYSYAFQYNVDGKISRCEQSVIQASGGSNTFKYDSMVYENGNLTKQYTYYATSATGPFYLQEYSLTTYSDQPNKVGYHAYSFVEEPTSILSGFYPFFHMYGNGSNNLPVETSVFTNTGTLSFKMSYNYLLDEKGYLIEENVSRGIIAPSTENRRFYYTCE